MFRSVCLFVQLCTSLERVILIALVDPSSLFFSPFVNLRQIVLSHFSRSTEDLGVLESFPDRQLRTTMDVVCDPSIEFIHGGESFLPFSPSFSFIDLLHLSVLDACITDGPLVALPSSLFRFHSCLSRSFRP
jgi:hypothetical protein